MWTGLEIDPAVPAQLDMREISGAKA